MKNNYEKYFLNWLKKGNEDESSAIWLLESKKGAPSTIAFLSQQIAEKYLKGFLVFHENPLKKIHNLFSLEELVSKIDPRIKELHNEIKLLNDFYIESRYPGEIEFTWKLAEKGLQASQRLKQFILDYFEKHESNGN